jgi:hypothetical protein
MDRANNDLGFEVRPLEQRRRGLIMEYPAAYQIRSLSFCKTAEQRSRSTGGQHQMPAVHDIGG